MSKYSLTLTQSAEVNRAGHYIKFNYNYHPCTNYVDEENDIQNSSPTPDIQSIPWHSVDCIIAVMLTNIVAISLFLIKEIISNTKKKIHKSPLSVLRDLRVNNHNRIIIGQLNINSIFNKFEVLTYIIENAIDIFLVSETKFNDIFHKGQFPINGYSQPHRLDLTDKGGELILFIQEHIPCKFCLDNKGCNTGILLTDLSKAFHCLIYNLLIAKLHAYRYEYNLIKLIYSYFSGRFQRVWINSTYSSWSEILFGIPQGSILGYLLFIFQFLNLV